MLKDDNVFGIQEFEIEGLELLDQADITIAIAQPWDQVTTGTAKDPEDFGQRPTTGGDDNSSIASDSSHAQQEKVRQPLLCTVSLLVPLGLAG